MEIQSNFNKSQKSNCTFCRVSGTILFSSVTIYAFYCAKKAKGKPIDRIFSSIVGISAFGVAIHRALGL
ncbi:uncharacterized protein BdWA1_003544 [Babesia duncani]|uniref:DUF4536 domain-containing protein n=1 Tax=Babesia duncani TaxID=323732 RepID=A0AAD9PIC1_9APIC|nr:hypothetical protein BdWA1_003544 [Babesia duncani]